MRVITFFLFCFLLLAGCKAKQQYPNADSSEIPAEIAYKLINEGRALVILDVRTETEFRKQRIESANLVGGINDWPYETVRD
jgi:hypothetical protein